MMRRIGLLLLVILVESCVAQTDCGTIKPPCKNKGGFCQPKDTDCAGKLWPGKKFCENWKDCNCCANCSKGIKLSCKILNGTCMKRNESCNGTEVIHNKFCKYPDTCKCCIPDCVCNPVTCTYENQDGHCSRYPLTGTISVGPQECTDGCQCYIEDNNCENERKCERPDAESEGFYSTGLCRKECHDDEVRWDQCNINPHGSCNCCLRKKICNPVTCTYENQDGHCSRYPLTGTISVGPQECTDGCQCYIEDNNCENERKCERPNAESEGYYSTGHCRKECHDDEVLRDSCDISNTNSCYCCLRKKEKFRNTIENAGQEN